MTKKIYIYLITVFLICVSANPSKSDEANDEEKRKPLKGWKGIVFYCPNFYSGQSKISIDALCNKIKVNADFLATAAGLKINFANNFTDTYILSTEGDAIILYINFFITDPDANAPGAIYADIHGFRYYSQAINEDFLATKIEKQGRRADAIFWDDHYLGAYYGNIHRHIDTISNSMNENLKVFFTAFKKANPK